MSQAYDFNESVWDTAVWYAQYKQAKQAGGYPGLRKLRLRAERALRKWNIPLKGDGLMAAVYGENFGDYGPGPNFGVRPEGAWSPEERDAELAARWPNGWSR